MAAFDIESTGVDVENDRIVTASVVEVAPGRKPVIREWLANPGIDIPAEATAIHGITTEHARAHGRDPLDVCREISGVLADLVEEGKPIVIFNAPYDLTLLDRECRRYDDTHPVYGCPSLHERCEDDGLNLYVIDPLVLDREMDRWRKGSGARKLTYLCQKVYNIPLSDEDAHGSSADALAAARVAWKIAHLYPECGELKLDELQRKQAEWYERQALSLGEWLVRQGKPNDVDPSWPIRPFAEPDALLPEPERSGNRGGLL
jgi:DNA polymerase-3 subunit epsilon